MINSRKLFQQLIFIICFLNTIISARRFAPTKGELDDLYLKVLQLSLDENWANDHNPDKITLSLDKTLTDQLEIAILRYEIVAIFGLPDNLEHFVPEIYDRKWQEFAELSKEMDRNPKMPQKCKLWKFWRTLGDLFAEHHMLLPEKREFVENRVKIDVSKINCHEMELILADIDSYLAISNFQKRDQQPKYIYEYITDQRILHFLTIFILIEPRQNSGRAEKIYKFVDYFSNEKLENETNIAFHLRMFRIKNLNQKIIAAKDLLQLLIGPLLLNELEFKQPMALALDIVGTVTLATKYSELFWAPEPTSKNAETEMSIRIEFGRIMQIFVETHQLMAIDHPEHSFIAPILSIIEATFDNQFTQFLDSFQQNPDHILLSCVHTFWHILANAFNLIANNSKVLEPIQIGNRDMDPLYRDQSDSETIQRFVREELLEDHTKIMVLLYGVRDNDFAKILRDPKTDLSRMKQFYADQNPATSKIAHDNYDILIELIEKYPSLKQMLRLEFTDEQITKMQMYHYPIFMNIQTSELRWKQSQFILELLAYYQWFKWHIKECKTDLIKQLNNNMILIPIWTGFCDKMSEELLTEFGFPYIKVLEKLKIDAFLEKNKDKKGKKKKGQNILDALNSMSSNIQQKLHIDLLKALLHSRTFKQKIKNLKIDDERMSLLFGHSEFLDFFINQENETSTSAEQVELNIETKEPITEEEHQEYALVQSYQNIMMMEDKPSKKSIKKLNIDALYFHLRSMIKIFLDKIRSIKPKSSNRFKEMATQIEKEADQMQILELITISDQKLIKICYMKGFYGRIICNLTMEQENAKWRKYVAETIIKIKMENLSTEDHWEIPTDCEKSEKANSIFQQYSRSPLIENTHSWNISMLFQNFPQFYKFVNDKAHSMPGIREYATLTNDDRLNFYKSILGSELEKAQLVEKQLLLKMFIVKLNSSHGIIITKEILMASIRVKAEVLAMMKIFNMFSNETPFIRMYCPIIEYRNWLDHLAKNSNVNWMMPLNKCFGNKAEEVFETQKIALKDDHFEFLMEYLVKCAKEDELITILQKSRYAMYQLFKLVGNKNLVVLWKIQDVREKLLNPQLRLLEHYSTVLRDSSDLVRLRHRIAADLTILENDFIFQQRSLISETRKQFVDHIWLYFRIWYDGVLLEEPHETVKMSYMISNFMPEIRIFIFNNQKQNKKLPTDDHVENALLNKWTEMTKNAYSNAELKWIESDNKPTGPSDLVQKLHFLELEKLMNDKSNEKIAEKCDEIIKVLTANKEYQKNLLQILTFDDTEKFLKRHGIDYDRADFIENTNEIIEESNIQKRNKKKNKRNKNKKQLDANNSMEREKLEMEMKSKNDSNEHRHGQDIEFSSHRKSEDKADYMDTELKIEHYIESGIERDTTMSADQNGSTEEKLQNDNLEKIEPKDQNNNEENKLVEEEIPANKIEITPIDQINSTNESEINNHDELINSKEMTTDSAETMNESADKSLKNLAYEHKNNYNNNNKVIIIETKNRNEFGNGYEIDNMAMRIDSQNNNGTEKQSENEKTIVIESGNNNGPGNESEKNTKMIGTENNRSRIGDGKDPRGNHESRIGFGSEKNINNEVERHHNTLRSRMLSFKSLGTHRNSLISPSGSRNTEKIGIKSQINESIGRKDYGNYRKVWSVKSEPINTSQLDNEVLPKIVDGQMNLMVELSQLDSLLDFCEESTLYSKYKEYILFSSIEKRQILDIAIYINEIEHRVQIINNINALDYLRFFVETHVGEELKSRWSQIKDEIATNRDGNVENLQKLRQKLYNFLTEILEYIEGYGVNTVKKSKQEFKNRKILHLRNFNMALLSDSEFDKIWANLCDKEKKEKFRWLVNETYFPERFENSKIGWAKMLDQCEIDRHLFNGFVNPLQQNAFLTPEFPKISYQINILANKATEENMIEKLEHYLESSYKGLSRQMTIMAQFNERLLEIINEIDSMIQKWSTKLAKLFVTGSILLGSHYFDSDVNLICMVPGNQIDHTRFFGTSETECPEQCLAENDNFSFYCRLCEHENITDLVKLQFGTALIIRFKFGGIDTNIAFVSMPDVEELPDQIDDQTIARFIEKFDFENFEQNKMLRTLSSYRTMLTIGNFIYDDHLTITLETILKIAEPIQNHNKPQIFRSMYLTLKLWAKNHYIYSNKFGYLNAMMLIIMVTKIMLLYPNASIPFMLEKFFLIYSTRPLNMPIQLISTTNYSLKIDPFRTRNPVEMEMPVFTPAFPEQNAARLVTHSTAKMIRRTMIETLNKFKSMPKNNFDWNFLLNSSMKFEQKYANFIAINCMTGDDQIDVDNFCKFVDWRIRLQITFDIDKPNGNIETQLYPEIYADTCRIASGILNMNLVHCKIWLVGVNLLNDNNPLGEIRSALDQFDLNIKRHYLQHNNVDGSEGNYFFKYKNASSTEIESKFKELKFNLKSILVKREELLNHL